MAETRREETPGPVDIVAQIVKDPKQPPDTLLLTGYTGASTEEGYTRLYLDPQLSDYVEIPNDAILLTQPIPREQSPLGGSYIWIKRDAEVIHGKAAPQTFKAKFLEGRIALAAAQTTGAAATAPGAAVPTQTIDSFVLCPSRAFVCPVSVPPRCPTVPPLCPHTVLGCPPTLPPHCLLSAPPHCPPHTIFCPVSVPLHCPTVPPLCPHTVLGCPVTLPPHCLLSAPVNCPTVVQCGPSIAACPSVACGLGAGVASPELARAAIPSIPIFQCVSANCTGIPIVCAQAQGAQAAPAAAIPTIPVWQCITANCTGAWPICAQAAPAAALPSQATCVYTFACCPISAPQHCPTVSPPCGQGSTIATVCTMVPPQC